MTDRERLIITPEERIAHVATHSARGPRGGWAAVASFLCHGTALAAVLIAASGEGPRMLPPTIEVTLVVAGTPPPGSDIVSETEFREHESPRATVMEEVREADEMAQVTPASGPVEDVSETEATQEIAESAQTQPVDPVPPAAADPAPVLVAIPPPPARKPDLPRPAKAPQSQAERATDTQARAQPRSQQPEAAAKQLAVLPEGEDVDAAATGADTAVPPRYQPGGAANPWPRYPIAARRRSLEGEVLLRVLVNAEGAAERVEVVRSSGHGLLDRAAIEALARWRFEPAQAGGRPVAGTIEIPVTFRLTDPQGSRDGRPVAHE